MPAPVHVPEEPIAPLGDAWRTCIGTGRFNLALRSDYAESLALTQREIGFRYIRGHGLLSDDVGVHRPYDVDGWRGTRYGFAYVDQVVDSYLSLGIKPFLELGFMPGGLASGDQTQFWWAANVTPPRDHDEWAATVQALLRHLVDRYGLDEVRTWPVEVWNEPNLRDFWSADRAAYLHLYEVTARAVKDVDAVIAVGGPAVSPGADDWWEPFAVFVESRDVPCDFVSSHAYASGPSQHVPFGTYQTLRPSEHLLEQFGTPRRLLAGTRLADLPVHITEFNTSYRPDNPIHDTAHNASYLAPVLAGGGDLVDSFSYWTFCDVFEEQNIPTSFFHGGFGLLTHRQVRKPTFHLYSFMARLGDDVLARGADHLVTRDRASGRVVALVWQPTGGTDQPEEPESHRVRLDLPWAAYAAYVHTSTVDEHAGNAFSAWREMGRPLNPTARQVDLLHEASNPVRAHEQRAADAGRLVVETTVGRHGIALVEIEPVVDETPAWLDDRRIVGRTP